MISLTTKQATLAQTIKNNLTSLGWTVTMTREKNRWTVTTDAPVETLQRVETDSRA